jgi:hypothetical protein
MIVKRGGDWAYKLPPPPSKGRVHLEYAIVTALVDAPRRGP